MPRPAKPNLLDYRRVQYGLVRLAGYLLETESYPVVRVSVPISDLAHSRPETIGEPVPAIDPARAQADWTYGYSLHHDRPDAVDLAAWKPGETLVVDARGLDRVTILRMTRGAEGLRAALEQAIGRLVVRAQPIVDHDLALGLLVPDEPRFVEALDEVNPANPVLAAVPVRAYLVNRAGDIRRVTIPGTLVGRGAKAPRSSQSRGLR